MSRGGIRTVRREIEANHKDRYEQAYNKYTASQFTYGSHNLIQKLLQNSKKHSHMNGVPVYSTLIEVCKIMMLNQLELLFFGAIVEQMKWRIVDTSFTQYMEAVDELSPKQKRDPNSKKVELFLLLIAYTVKKYLNEEMSLFDFKIREIFKNSFDKMYQDWVTKVQVHFKFNPRSMNGTFRQLNKVEIDQQQQIVNYNEKVDELFKSAEEEPFKPQANSSEHPTRQIYREKPQPKKYQQKVQAKYSHKDNLKGVPVEQEDDDDVVVPGFINKGYSGRSQVSDKNGKRDSSSLFFSRHQLKQWNNAPIPLSKIVSQDEFGPN